MNASHSRHKRVQPERGGPIRNPLTGAPPRPSTTTGPAEALRGALECGVQTAYAVIDEYMKRGYEAARMNPLSQNGKGHMSHERQNYGSWSGPWGPMTPLMDQWASMMKMWTDAWTAWMPGGRFGNWPQAWTAAASGFSSQAAGAPTPISVEVRSLRPTEVSVHLKPGAELMELTAESFKPELHSPITLSSRPGRLKVRVSVAHDQPAGRYSGVIRTADGSIAGDITITISESSAERE